MTPGAVCRTLRHAAFDSRSGAPIGEARLNDRARLGVVLQGAALLSHLEAAGWELTSDWPDLEVDRDGVVCAAVAAPGIASRPVSAQLIDLLEIVFGSRERLTGKGAAIRIADRLLQTCRHAQGALSPNRVVTGLLRAADFFWQPAYSPARQSLVAELIDQTGSRVHIAGPGRFERRLLARDTDLEYLCELTSSPEIRRIWAQAEPWTAAGSAPATGLEAARQLHLRGHWQSSLQALAGVGTVAAVVLEVECLRRLGNIGSAQRALESVARRSKITPAERHAIVETGVALCLGSADCRGARDWMRRLEIDREGRIGPLQRLLAAEIALVARDWCSADRHLGGCRQLRQDPRFSWRWYRVAAHAALWRGDLGGAESRVLAGLLAARRQLSRVDAGGLWTLLARIRVDRGEAVSAKKAACHALRLLEDVDESAAVTSARLLSETRLRLGEAAWTGSSPSMNAGKSGTPESACGPGVGELDARRELLAGRPGEAWRLLEPQIERSESRDAVRQARLQALAARALGWLGRGADAREVLERAESVRPSGLEPEEHPAVWALAGDWLRAREVVTADTVGRLWCRVLQGEAVTEGDWRALSSLPAYRGARMVFDIQLLVANKVPPAWLDWAAAVLRQVGAGPFAERLDRSRQGAWGALRRYLETASGKADELETLFRSSGYFDVRLEWSDESTRSVLLPGGGGALELRTKARWGDLVLSSASKDPVLEALLSLAARDFRPKSESFEESALRAVGIVGRSRALRSSMVRLERLATTDLTVLVRGETGTGKELAARQLHRWSPRASERFVAVNCAALSESLLLSELFGHARGAFTGADRDRQGIFEAAAGGTVLLDEIGDLPLTAQGKLLRVLQEGEVRRVGESLPRRVEVRIVAATHRDLELMVEKGTFRRDLFFRLKAGDVELPPLRSREGDVLLLSEHFLRGSGCSLSRGAQQRLVRHPWPGNVRELRNVLEVARALSDGRLIDEGDLGLPRPGSGKRLGYHQQVEEFRRRLVQDALRASAGNRSEAARQLGVSRQALSYLVRRFGGDGS